jgi:hypothetical protein
MIATTYTLLLPSGEKVQQIIEWPAKPGFKMIEALVAPFLDGAHLEHVSVLFQGERCSMFVDEAGQRKGLERNEEATKVYRTFLLGRYPKMPPENLSFIVGPAVLFHRNVWF